MKINFKHQYVVLIIFIALSSIGLSIYKDFGIGTDEYINRINGGVSLNYLIEIIFKFTGIKIWENDYELLKFTEHLTTYKDRDYGVAFDLPLIILERLFIINSSQDQYLYRHLITHSIFLIGVYFFYKTLKDRFNSWKLGIFGCIALYTSPRIFAESFYNNKDIIFMSLMIVALYYSIKFIRKPSLPAALISSITTAIATDTRIIGVIVLMITSSLLLFKLLTDKNKNIIRYLIIYLSISILFIIAFWPWLWMNPLDHFIQAFTNMAKFRWLNWVLYRGHYYPSTNLPWHYLPIWISITTPLLYLALFPVGCFRILKDFIQKRLIFIKSNGSIQDITNLAIVILPIAAAILMKSTIYDGWRQFYFLYPSLIYISISSFVLISNKFYNSVLIFIASIAILVNIYWLHNNHPYQNVYFNIFAGKNWSKKFEGDYWGLTNTQGLKYILAKDSSKTIKVFSVGNTSLSQAFLMLTDSERERFKIVDQLTDSDYALTNFRFLIHPADFYNFESMINHFSFFYEITVDNNVIFAIYKNK